MMCANADMTVVLGQHLLSLVRLHMRWSVGVAAAKRCLGQCTSAGLQRSESAAHASRVTEWVERQCSRVSLLKGGEHILYGLYRRPVQFRYELPLDSIEAAVTEMHYKTCKTRT